MQISRSSLGERCERKAPGLAKWTGGSRRGTAAAGQGQRAWLGRQVGAELPAAKCEWLSDALMPGLHLGAVSPFLAPTWP